MKFHISFIVFFIVSVSISGCLGEEKDKENVDLPHLPEIISITTSPDVILEGDELNVTVQVKECHVSDGSIRIHEEDIDAVLGPKIFWKSTRLNGGGGGSHPMRWIGGDNFTSSLEVKNIAGIYQFLIFAPSDEFYIDSDNSERYELYSTRSEWHTVKINNTVLYEKSISIVDRTIIADEKDGTIRFNISFDVPDNSEDVKFIFQMISWNGGHRGGSGPMLHIEGDHYTYIHEEILEEHLEGMEFWIVIRDSENQFYTTEHYKLTEEDIP